MAGDNAVVVVMSDPHMNLDAAVNPICTNLDPRLPAIINSMTPPPKKLIVLGDVCTTLAPIPGWYPRGWSLNYGTNEMAWWSSAISAITNIDSTNILWIPGNHDQFHYETNAEIFRMMFPEMPTYQRVDVSGTRLLLLNTGNNGHMDKRQVEWLRDEVDSTPGDLPLVALTHVPPFAQGMKVCWRHPALVLRDVFGKRTNNWRVFSGHFHSQSLSTYRIGESICAAQVIGTSNPKATNGKSSNTGFTFLCLSNGVAGVVYYHYNTGDFQVLPEPDWLHPNAFSAAFEEEPGLLWRRLKSAGNAPEVLSVTNDDAVEWYAYTKHLELSLQFNLHSNLATDFLLLSVALEPSAITQFSADRTNWSLISPRLYSNGVYRFPIPPELALLPTGYFRITTLGTDSMIGGWGLATDPTNHLITYPQLDPVANQGVVCEQDVWITNRAFSPYAPPDQLRYTMVGGPASATLDSQTGVFYWRPPCESAGSSVSITIKASDEGTPEMSDSVTFSLVVHDPRPALLAPRFDNGEWVMTLRAEPPGHIALERSTNLVHWDFWHSISTTIPETEIRDTVNIGVKYYRALREP